MEAIAKYDFKATADDELSFKRGDILKVSVMPRRCRDGLLLYSSTFVCPDNTKKPSPSFLGAQFSRLPWGGLRIADTDAEWNIKYDLGGLG